MRFLLILALALSQSPPVQQKAQEGARQSNDPSARQKPVSPHIATPPQTVPQPHQAEPADLHWYSDVRITDGLIALFTLGLVIVGFFQWRALNDTVIEAGKASARQSADMLASIAVTQDAAKAATESAAAAKTSADAYREAERAWVAFVKVDYGPFENATNAVTGETGQSGTQFNMRWVNSGRTPAIECILLSAFRFMHNPSGTDVPTFDTTLPPDAQKMVLVPGISVSSPPMNVLKRDIDRLIKGQGKVWLYGRAEYRDVFSTEQRRHFEICLELEYGGVQKETGMIILLHHIVGPQNSAT